jgi:hypothetical protein
MQILCTFTHLLAVVILFKYFLISSTKYLSTTGATNYQASWALQPFRAARSGCDGSPYALCLGHAQLHSFFAGPLSWTKNSIKIILKKTYIYKLIYKYNMTTIIY